MKVFLTIITAPFSRSQKDNLKQVDQQEEQRLVRGQKEYLDLEIRKFRRKRLMALYNLQQELLREELNKRQAQLEQAHWMLLRHHEKTQELEYRQQRSVHALKEDQVQRQHQTELSNQNEYMLRSERELRKKHALELKQQPKSLKVSYRCFLYILNIKFITSTSLLDRFMRLINMCA